MYRLFQKQELWGYRPLFFFLCAWFSIKAFGYFISKKNQDLNLWGLSTLSGVLLWLGFPSMPFTPLMFLAFVPLLMVEEIISRKREKPSKKLVFKYAYHSFVIWNILSTFWVTNTSFLPGIFAIFVNAFLMCIPFVLYHQSKKVLSPMMAAFTFVSFWISFEHLHMQWELSWPWLTLGNAFAQYPSWIQWYEITGHFGGSLWILALNYFAFLAACSFYFNKNRPKPLSAGLWILAIVLPIGASLLMYQSQEETDTNKGIEVVVVQPNFEPHYEKFSFSEGRQFDRFVSLSKSKLTENSSYLVFPETSFGRVRTNDLPANSSVRKYKKLVDAYPNLSLVTGVNSHRVLEKGDPKTTNTRTHVQSNGDTMLWESHNAAIQIESGQKEVALYLKGKFVPGSEVFPFKNILPFMEPLVDLLGGSVAGLASQPERSVFTSQEGYSVAPVICYESIYGEYTTGYIRKGANLIFIVTNDGWWDDTPGHVQHLKFASLRAIETRRAIARSANTGISAFINKRGDILQPTKYGEAAAIRGNVIPSNEITFYVKWGDLIVRFSLVIAGILLLLTVARSFMPSDAKLKEQA